MGLLNPQRDRRLSANVVLYTAILVQYRDIFLTRLGQADLSGYESAQRKRFLRAEIEEEKLAAAAGRRHLLKLERQVG